jgi:hypothetical protein
MTFGEVGGRALMPLCNRRLDFAQCIGAAPGGMFANCKDGRKR